MVGLGSPSPAWSWLHLVALALPHPGTGLSALSFHLKRRESGLPEEDATDGGATRDGITGPLAPERPAGATSRRGLRPGRGQEAP